MQTTVEKLGSNFGTAIFEWLEKFVAQQSLVGDCPLFTAEQFPWVATLEDNWQVIRQELEGVLADCDRLPNYQDISQRQTKITNDNRWKTYFFFAYGFKSALNCQQCPRTAELVQQIPGMKVAFFSILAPHKHIPAHRGLHKGVIRYHLGLVVPQPEHQCRIRIADQILHWQEGKSLLFDDTFDHEVWNDTDGYRVVLFLDVARPLKPPAALLNWLVNRAIAFSPIVQEAKRNHVHWENQKPS
jgi:ornithine lipid ester-linked acyl 2-hydroxylase